MNLKCRRKWLLCMQTADEENVSVGFWRLLGLASPEWLWLVIGLLASSVLGAVRPLVAVLLATSFAMLEPGHSEADSDRIVIFFVALAGIQIVLSTAQVCPSGHPFPLRRPALFDHACTVFVQMPCLTYPLRAPYRK